MKCTWKINLYHACMGTAILLLSIHAVYVGVNNLKTAVEVFRMEYFFNVPFCIDHIVYPGLAVSAALMLLSGAMGILSFLRCKDGGYIVRLGIIRLVQSCLQVLLNMTATRRWYIALIYVLFAVIIILYGKGWRGYLRRNPEPMEKKVFFPYIREFKFALDTWRSEI